MAKEDIFSMTQAEFSAKFKVLHKQVQEENARYGLPTTGYSEIHKCVVNTYIDGRVEKVNINKTLPNVPKNQFYPGI